MVSVVGREGRGGRVGGERIRERMLQGERERAGGRDGAAFEKKNLDEASLTEKMSAITTGPLRNRW